MRKFFVMVLLVSTFFIGLGAIVDRAGANMKSDAKALEIIRQSRMAIGGDANIENVRSLRIAGNLTHYSEQAGMPQTDSGTMEINLQLPNKFTKMVKIGNPDSNAGNMQKRIEVIVTKDAAGNILTENVRGVGADDANSNPKSGVDKKIIIKKDDGTVQELNTNDQNVFVFKKDDNPQTFKTEDGKTFVIKRDVKTEDIYGSRNNEMLRTTFALLLSAPQGVDVSYTFAGEGNVDGYACNIVEAATGGSSFKLFIDKSNYLPRMMSFTDLDTGNIIINSKSGSDDSNRQVKVLVRNAGDLAQTEHQIKFSDFRSAGNLLLPYRWSETVAGKQSQTTEITAYEFNPADIADRFKNPQVIIRTTKKP